MEQDDLAKKVGKNLKNLFISKGVTYEDVGEIVGFDSRTVGRWIQNGLDKLSTIELIAQKFDVKVQDIIFPEKK